MIRKLYNLFLFGFLPFTIIMTAIKINKLNSSANRGLAIAMGWEVDTSGSTTALICLIILFVILVAIKLFRKSK